MNLLTSLRSDWPRLAWLARGRAGDSAVRVWHGAGVETGADFVCEAVWDGPFAEGGFDRTDNVFGSGVRVRGSQAVFVTSCGTNDRLASARVGDEVFVSNSLPGIMRAIGVEPSPTERHYPELLESAVLGLGRPPLMVPTTGVPIRLSAHHNLAWDGQALSDSLKPWPERDFTDFESYHGFLDTTLAAFAGNMADPARGVRRTFLGTMSSGYDSTTCAALARPHGLREAISFTSARGGEDDSGAEVAKVLGIAVTAFPRDGFRQIPFAETAFIASDAKGEDVYFAAAGDMLRDRVLLTGYLGDSMWGKHTTMLDDRIVRSGGGSGMSHAEFRLHAGFIHVTPAYLAVRDIRKVHAIGQRADMQAWSVGGKYDRPIARRIVESTGVPREAFGQAKKAASVLFGHNLTEMSDAGRADYERWRREHDRPGARDAMVRNLARVRGRLFRNPAAARVITALEGPYHHPRMLPGVGGLIDDVRRSSIGLTQRNTLFRWATEHELKRYPRPVADPQPIGG